MTESAITRPQAAFTRPAGEEPRDEELGSRSSAPCLDTHLRDNRTRTRVTIDDLWLGFIAHRLLRLATFTTPRELPLFSDPVLALHSLRTSPTPQGRRRLQADLKQTTLHPGEELRRAILPSDGGNQSFSTEGDKKATFLNPFQDFWSAEEEGIDTRNKKRREQIGEILGPIMNPNSGKAIVLLCWGTPDNCQILPITVDETPEGVELWNTLQRGWYQARGSWRKRMPYWQVKRVEEVKVRDGILSRL